VSEYAPVCAAADLVDGDIVPIAVGGRALVLCRVGDAYFATQRRCLHQGGDLAEGVTSGGHIVCAVHGWRFDLRTGCHELSPGTCLRTHAVEVRDGTVFVATIPRPLR
jgi:nitrite reductase/ring-hydroxylating ferredoxin subunit